MRRLRTSRTHGKGFTGRRHELAREQREIGARRSAETRREKARIRALTVVCRFCSRCRDPRPLDGAEVSVAQAPLRHITAGFNVSLGLPAGP